jgi:4-hydroxybenzoate polyprenyltransferase
VSQARAVLVSMRPKQWTKNLLVFAPLIFAGDLDDPRLIAIGAAAFAVFCMIAGAAYIFNDLTDLQADKLHRKKRARPLAAGELSPRVAVAAAAALTAVSLAGAFALGRPFALVVIGYALLQVAYTLYLRHQVILDVMALATGFVLRAVGGAAAIAVSISPWLLVCTALLALFLGLAKRRHELVLLEEDAEGHRPVLGHYSAELVDEMISAVTSSTIVAYALYTFFSPTAAHTRYLMLTVPFVVYGLFRYLYLIHEKNLGGNPEDLLLADIPLMVDIVLWLAAVVILLYPR